jgi:small subunit ribosomal protein S6
MSKSKLPSTFYPILIPVHKLTTHLSLHSICRTTGNLILSSGGVVRGITNWGVFRLPKPTKGLTRGGTRANAGHYFIVRFDSNAATQAEVKRILKLEPRMLRFSVVKLGTSLEDISKHGGTAEEWSNLGEAWRGKTRDDSERVRASEDSLGQL